jgi:hypothetical protein
LDGVHWPFGDLYYVYRFYTHWQQETLFVACQTLSRVVICCYCHLCTKICDPTHTHTHKLWNCIHFLSFCISFDRPTLDTHAFNTTAHGMCVCVCVCARARARAYTTCKRLKVIREDYRLTAGNLLLPVSM